MWVEEQYGFGAMTCTLGSWPPRSRAQHCSGSLRRPPIACSLFAGCMCDCCTTIAPAPWPPSHCIPTSGPQATEAAEAELEAARAALDALDAASDANLPAAAAGSGTAGGAIAALSGEDVLATLAAYDRKVSNLLHAQWLQVSIPRGTAPQLNERMAGGACQPARMANMTNAVTAVLQQEEILNCPPTSCDPDKHDPLPPAPPWQVAAKRAVDPNHNLTSIHKQASNMLCVLPGRWRPSGQWMRCAMSPICHRNLHHAALAPAGFCLGAHVIRPLTVLHLLMDGRRRPSGR